MVNNTGIKLINDAKKQGENNQSIFVDTYQNSLNDSFQDTCYFKEKLGHTKMDGIFLWTKG